VNKGKVCFLVGSMNISGGTYVILQHAIFLHEHGYDVTLAVQEPFTLQTLFWHDQAMRLTCVPIDVAKNETYDLVIATWWKTVFELQYFNSPRYAYFVQSIESRFYPSTEVPLRTLVDATYQFPCAYLTEAAWIRDYLTTGYRHEVALVRNGIRKDIYRPTGPSKAPRDANLQPRVLVEGHFGVPFKNTALGVRLAHEAGAKNIWVLTGTPVKWLPYVSQVFSRVPMYITPEIYRSCDILVKLSTVEGMFGPPLEMFHCGGTAIVFDVTGHDEYIVDKDNAYVAKCGDMDGVVTLLQSMLNDRTELARLRANALKTADAWPSWNESSAAFNDWVESALVGYTSDREVFAELSKKAFLEYSRDEKERLANVPRISQFQPRKLAARIPTTLRHSLKQIEAAGEVLFGPREVR